MPKLIKDGQLVQDDAWQVIDDEQDIQDYSIISLPRWQENKEALLIHAQAGKLGVWIDSHENVDSIGDDSSSFTLIAVNFPVFTDGRGYSTARLLRERYTYQGEIRAIGDVLVDQLHNLQRVGFDSYLMREDQELEDVLRFFKPFSNPYQADVRETKPLFRRRDKAVS